MEQITYQQYLANPEIRERLEREARRARAQAMCDFTIAPLKKMVMQMFLRSEPKPARPIHVPA